jgi:hypothetical protein
MLNEHFKAAMTTGRFKLSGIIGIFKALVKPDISAMKPKVETSMKWGTIFLLPAKVDPERPMSLYLFFL